MYIVDIIKRLKVVDLIIVFGFNFLDLKFFLIILMIDSRILGVLVLRVSRFRFVIVLF